MTHRKRVLQHFAGRVEAGLADRLAGHMMNGRLSMWDPEDSNAKPDAYIVMYHDSCAKHGGVDVHVRNVEAELTLSGTGFYHYGAALHGFYGKFKPEQLDRLLADDCVKSIEQDYTIKLDPKVETQPSRSTDVQPGAIWGLDQIDGTVDGQYQYVNNGTGVYIYIVDTGIQITHNEFQTGAGSRAVAGADFVDMNEDFNAGDLLGNSCGGNTPGECSSPGAGGCTCGTIPRGMPDCSGHGTHCAGTAAGNLMGVAKGATVVAVRVLNCDGSGTSSAVVAGMDYVVRMKRDKHPSAPAVMSMSLGGSRPSESYNDPSLDPKWAAVAAAKALGVSVVVAAGNSGVDVDTRSPAHIDDAITVAANNVNKQRAYFSCFGPGVDVFAPGYKVNSAVTGGDDAYEEYSGTSMSTPHVAGMLALMLQHNSDWSVEQQVAELTGDCAETGSVDLFQDSLNPFDTQCIAGQTDERCNVPDSENPNNCHGCNNKDKCASRNSYTPPDGDWDTPCGWYSQMDGQCEGVCICYCGGKYCDATYIWGIWLDFCCNTYFASCEPDSVTATPNLLTNIFGSGQCAAGIPSGSSPAPPPGPTPPAPQPTPGPSPTPPSTTPAPSPPRRRSPVPSPSPPPGDCQDWCSNPSDCTDYPFSCSPCSFCGGSPSPSPTPSPPRRRSP